MKKVAVIGSGPSGLMSIYSLVKNGYKDITLFESDNQIGRKIKVSGNGKCNFFHIPIDYSFYSNSFIAKEYMNDFLNDYEEIFNDLGLKYFFDNEGRVYPRSESSKTVVKLFERFLNMNNIKIKLNTYVNKVINKNNKLILNYNEIEEEYDFVVLAIGGFSYNANKEIKNKFMHDSNIKLTKITPALTPIKTTMFKNKKLEGKRFKVNLFLYENNKKIYEEYGEILIKKDGISGIVTFNISSILARKHLSSYNDYQIGIDFAPYYSYDELKYEIYNSSFTIEENLQNLFIEELKDEFMHYIKNDLISKIKNYKVKVIDLYPFESSQVTSGGIDLTFLNNMLIDNNIYPCGEILDIDGMCGGYNIAFAFASGYNVKNVI